MDDEIASAFKNGDYKKASELLQKVRDSENIGLLWFYPQNYKPICCNMYKVTLLHLAAYHGWLDICHQLITVYKYDPHVRLSFGSLIDHSKTLHVDPYIQFTIPPPPLFYATLGGHIDIVTYLIEKCKCDPRQQSKDGETPLYLACFGRHYEIVTHLSHYIPAIDILSIQHDKMYTPLHKACLLGKLNTVEYLLSFSSVDVNVEGPSGYTPLHMVCLFGGLQPLDIAKLLISSSVDVNIKNNGGYSPLHIACHHGLLDMVKLLVSVSSVHVNSKTSDGSTPLHIACRHGHLDIVKFLLFFSSVDVNSKASDGSTPLHIACCHGHLDILEFLLLFSSVDVNSRASGGSTLLHTACCLGHLDIVKFLVSVSSLDVNSKASGGSTPLHKACRYGNLDIVKFLVSLSSVDVNNQASGGYTPLHTACRYGNLHIVKFLVSLSSVDANNKASDGSTPLRTACRYGYLDIVKFLVSLSSVDANSKASDGYTPLHTACYYGNLGVVRFLVSYSSVDVNIKASGGYTPLHTACRYGNLDIVKFFVSLSSVDVNNKASDGYTPLHTACRYDNLEIVKFFVSLFSVDVNNKASGGYTPLHTACRYGNLNIVKFLVSLSSVDVNNKDYDGSTPLHKACCHSHLDIVKFLVSLSSVDANIKASGGYTPLHRACFYDNLAIVKILVSLSSVDVNSKAYDGYTPLHTACHYGNLDIVKFLVSLSSVDVNSKDDNGYTPLHAACRCGRLDIVKFLVSLSSVDVNNKASSGYTTLHTACLSGKLNIVNFLVSLSSVDVNIQDEDGYTPLHRACFYGNLAIVKILVSLSSVDVNSKAYDGYTPLHTACRCSQLDIVQLLMSTAQVNPISTTKDGDTPLHIACRHNRVDIVKYLLSTGRIDPMAKNRYQKIPVQMAGDKYQILKIFEPFKQCRTHFPVESYSKVFLCGNTTNGKSSLAHALLQRVNGVHISWIDRYSPFKYHEQAEPLTAGIVPHHLQSNEIGNIVLYDFAGHPEYYSSHEAVLDNLMLRSPAVFIILIKLTDKLEDIEKQLYYWASFIQNVCCRVSKKSQVIVVGSHADKWRAMNAKYLIERLDIHKIISDQEYKGFVAVDCRNKDGVGFNELISYLTESTKATIDRSDNISFYCHVLYAFLKTKLAELAMTLESLLQKIQDENEPSLPSNESVLLELLITLSDKGLILFIRSTDTTSSWVIVDKISHLKEINGTLFAPSHFKEYRPNLASNTGIVSISVLKDVFPQYNVDMLVGFLKTLEFCHEIDKDTHMIITTNLSSSSEKLLYFPALVSVEPTSEVSITDGFGWCLWCPNPYQFFSTRFLQVLLLRLAYAFSLPVNDVGIIHKFPPQTLDRSKTCIVWKNGISWTRDGVKVVVQVSEQNRSVILLVQPLEKSLELESLQVRSLVVQKILQIKEEFCHFCDTQECLISSHHLGMALQYNLKDLSVFTMEDIARVVVLKKRFVTNDSETLNISLLLGQLEPYHTLPISVVQRLFDESLGKRYIPEVDFKEIQQRLGQIMNIYRATREPSTYYLIRDHLNRFSIFAGRNPFVSE